MDQCRQCEGYLFFKPLPDETFSCCSIRGETVEDINLLKGVSPAIEKYGLEGDKCSMRKLGTSICTPSGDRPFILPQVRIEGERHLKQALMV